MKASRATFGLWVLGLAALGGELLLALQMPTQSQQTGLRNSLVTPNEFGAAQTILVNKGYFDLRNSFFKAIGTNGRSCATCHVPEDGWAISPKHLQARFTSSKGLDPIFHRFDGTNSPSADQSTLDARRAASSMLLTKGLIRVGIGIPTGAEFTLDDVDDPYHYASASELSLFRRPMPSTNLRFLTGLMWDGRESTPLTGTLPIGVPSFSDAANFFNLQQDLLHQANSASRGHAQLGRDLTPDEANDIVNFEMNIVTSQEVDYQAGQLNTGGATGGVDNLSMQDFYVTINDALGGDHFGFPFNPAATTLYDAWRNSANPARAQVARGQALFSTKNINIMGVAGLNDDLHLETINGHCTTCHDTPNIGNHSVALPINIGLSDASRRTPDLPLYTLRNLHTGETVQTTDPGRALISGKWKDIGKFKGPIMRGLSTRAPYFHNGSAANFKEVIEFYDSRFNIGLTNQEKADLIAFLRTL